MSMFSAPRSANGAHPKVGARLGILGVLVALVFLVAVLLLLSEATGDADLQFGVHTLHPDDQTLRLAHDLGAQYIVQVFSWSEIEPTRGEFHWEYTDWLMRAAEYYDLGVVARIDKPPTWASGPSSALSAPPLRLQDYADFVAQVAARYTGRIAGYIIWNEPNLSREWGDGRPDPAAYVALLRAASGRIHAVDPKTPVLTAGLAPTNENSDLAMDDRTFLRGMYGAGARGTFDVLAAHPYGFANPPDDQYGAHKGLNFARLKDLRDIMVENGDVGKAVWITEFGYTTSPSPGSSDVPVTEKDQAQFLVGALELARQQWNWVRMFTVWNLSGEGPSLAGENTPSSAVGNSPAAEAIDQNGYSLLHADGSPKPAFTALRAISKEPGPRGLVHSALAAFEPHPASDEFSVLARDAPVHLGDSEYPAPWVPLYQDRNPSSEWDGEFYLRPADLTGVRRTQSWTLTMELMQTNDYDSPVTVNGQFTSPGYLPTQDFTSVWATARFQVSPDALREGFNFVSVRDGKVFPAFQQLGFTWDDFQLRNVTLWPP
jgi:hypothetical protein